MEDRIKNYPTNAVEANRMVCDVLKTVGMPYTDLVDCDEDFSEDPLAFLEKDTQVQRKKMKVDPKSSHKFSLNTSETHRRVGRPKNSKKYKSSIIIEISGNERSYQVRFF